MWSLLDNGPPAADDPYARYRLGGLARRPACGFTWESLERERAVRVRLVPGGEVVSTFAVGQVSGQFGPPLAVYDSVGAALLAEETGTGFLLEPVTDDGEPLAVVFCAMLGRPD